MALINFEHFDLYGGLMANLLLRGYTQKGATMGISASGRTGTNSFSIRSGAGGRQLIWPLPFPKDVVGMGAAIFAATAQATENNSHTGFRFGTTASSSVIRVIPNSVLGFSVYLNTILIGQSASSLFSTGSWFWLEVKVVNGAGTGSVEVQLNGSTVLTLTGLTLSAQWNRVSLGGDNIASSQTLLFDDWVVWDDVGGDIVNFMGDTFVLVAPPTADTAIADWTPTPAGALFSTIDEDTPDPSDFIQTDTIGHAAEFTHPAFNLGVGAIAAIASQTRALKSDAGAGSYRTGIKSSAASSMSDEIALATGPNVHIHIAERNPNGNIPWTQAAANAARLRVERSA